MDTEFINAYVNRQRDTLNDLLHKSIMLETRLMLAEEKLTKQAAQPAPVEADPRVAELEAKLAEVTSEKERLGAQVALLEQQLDRIGQ